MQAIHVIRIGRFSEPPVGDPALFYLRQDRNLEWATVETEHGGERFRRECGFLRAGAVRRLQCRTSCRKRVGKRVQMDFFRVRLRSGILCWITPTEVRKIATLWRMVNK